MQANINDDTYIATLLKEDAKNAKKKYELVGIDAFNPKRCVYANILPLPLMPRSKNTLHGFYFCCHDADLL